MYVRQLDERVLRLLQALQKHPELYYPSDQTSRSTRQKLWDHIAKSSGFAKTEDAKSRWRGLIIYFRQLLEDVAKKKYRRYIPKTDNPEDQFVKLSDWRYYEYFKFMEPHIQLPTDLPDPRSKTSSSKVAITKIDQSKSSLRPSIEISSAVQKPKFSSLNSFSSKPTSLKSTSLNSSSLITVQNQTAPILITPEVELAKIPTTIIQPETNVSSRSVSTQDHARSTTLVAQTSSQNTSTTQSYLQRKMKIGNVIFDIQFNKQPRQANVCMKNQHATIKTTTLPASKVTMVRSITKFEDLSSNDQNLKSFFDAMFKSTQRLPVYHQECVKRKLIKAVRNI